MPRRGPITPRKILPDHKYESVLFSKLINRVMCKGKKSVAERLCYEAMEIVKKKSGEGELKVFEKALDNVKPKVAVKARRVGGATYQVPIEVAPRKRVTLALRWLVNYARERPGRRFAEKLAQEILDAYHEQGGAFKKREEVHRIAEANRAFAHYRW